jgi:ketosteroid isomerase-like protein
MQHNVPPDSKAENAPMSKEAKQVARAYYDAMNSKDLDAIMALYTKGARTWVLGEGPYAGYNEVSRELLGGFLEAFDIKFTIVSMLSEGNAVSMEVESEGTLAGAPYSNRYHNLVTIQDGKISELKEYFDTAKAGG